MKSNKILLLSLCLAVSLLVAGCNQEPVTLTFEVTVISPTQGPGYPAPASTDANPPYPAEGSQPSGNEQANAAQPEPTQDPNLGRLSGTLLNSVAGEVSPVAAKTLYLAPIIKNAEGVNVVAALDRQSSPKAVTDENGNFAFPNLANGEYGLILDLVIESFLLKQPETEESLVIQILNGEKVELGELVYEDIPIPGTE